MRTGPADRYSIRYSPCNPILAERMAELERDGQVAQTTLISRDPYESEPARLAVRGGTNQAG